MLALLLGLLGCTSDGGGKDGRTADGGATATGDSGTAGDGGDAGDGSIADGGGSSDAQADNLATQAGAYAVDLLSDATYDSLLVEIDYVTGHAPSDEALDALARTLDELVRKPVGIDIVLDDELPDQGSPVWTYSAAEDAELTWRDSYRDPATGQAVVYYLYLDGSSEYDTSSGKILGYAYHGSSLIMFGETIGDTEPAVPLGTTVGEVVIVHELGHLLGLVDNGIPMVTDHKDPDHGDHDISSDCIMYWAVQTDNVVDLLLGGSLDFDDACRADVAAAGGKATR